MSSLLFFLALPSTLGSEFWLGRPKPERLHHFFARYEEAPPNSDVSKCTLPGSEQLPTTGFHVGSMSIDLEDANFAKAKSAVLDWGCDPAVASSFVARSDKVMATCAQTYVPGIWVVNPVKETYRINDNKRAAVAYTTLRGHLLQGEERLLVEKTKDGGLRLQVLSVSRGNGLKGAIVYPFIGPLQRRFFRAQLDFVEGRCQNNR